MQAAEEFVRSQEFLLGAICVHNLRPVILSQQRNPRLHRECLLLPLPPPFASLPLFIAIYSSSAQQTLFADDKLVCDFNHVGDNFTLSVACSPLMTTA